MYWHIMTAERYDDILALGVVILSRLSFFPLFPPLLFHIFYFYFDSKNVAKVKLVFVSVHNPLTYIKKMLESCKFIHKNIVGSKKCSTFASEI